MPFVGSGGGSGSGSTHHGCIKSVQSLVQPGADGMCSEGARVFRRLVVFMMCDSQNCFVVLLLRRIEFRCFCRALRVFSRVHAFSQCLASGTGSSQMMLAPLASSDQTPVFVPIVCQCAEQKLVVSTDPEYDYLNKRIWSTQLGYPFH